MGIGFSAAAAVGTASGTSTAIAYFSIAGPVVLLGDGRTAALVELGEASAAQVQPDVANAVALASDGRTGALVASTP